MTAGPVLGIPVIQDRADIQLALQFFPPSMRGIIGSVYQICILVESEVPYHRADDHARTDARPLDAILGLQGGADIGQQLVHVVDQVLPALLKGLFDGFPARQGTKALPVIGGSQFIGMLRCRGRRIKSFDDFIGRYGPFSMRRHLRGIDAAQNRHDFADSRRGTARQRIPLTDFRTFGIVHRPARPCAQLVPFGGQMLTDHGHRPGNGGTGLGVGISCP